ncbi:MAG TPA: NapC/NirT family cytochrome c [Candidatus Acidoferrales bacterium]|jgi:cytochrome c-type protein NapC|nr:NapC/NirT family cytochrome c [Candidatus Acidoferrales bacterium]
MVSPQSLLFILIGASIALILPFLVRPGIAVSREGKILAFAAFFILPVLAASIGASEHFERSKQTRFCLSCHIMAPWGKSLYVDDLSHLPAAHFQNHRIPVDVACYTCHSDYAMYGTLSTKLEGLHHVYVNYFGTPMNPIRLYHPYDNAACLHCHLGARSFESDPLHVAIMADLKGNKLSCLSSGCHDKAHDVAALDQQKFWTPTD